MAAAYALSGSPADLTALANLPATDPTNGGLYTLSYAQEKAWGLIPANGTELDGAIGFSTAFTWAVNPSDRAVSGDIDLIGVAEHELTHALGRIIYLPGAGDPTYTAMDLFRFASVGNLQLTYAQPSYFSVNGGRSGQDHPFDLTGDPADWASSISGDSFGYGAYDQVMAVTSTDLTLMNVLGFNVTAPGGNTPVVRVQNVSVGENSAAAASSLITSVSNPLGDTITEYAFWDAGTGNGHFTLNGVTQPDSQWITIAASALGSVQYVGGAGPGSETLQVEVFDATTSTWSGPSSLTATTNASGTAPVSVNVQNVAVGENAALAASTLITSIANPSGDNITQYGFWDGGTGNGHFTLNGVAQPDGQWITVAAGALSTVQYVGGAAPGSETLKVEVFDATTGTWSAASSLTATTTSAVVVNVRNISVTENASVAASALIASVSNPSGDSITQYGFWDAGTGNGHFDLNGIPTADGLWIVVSASNLSSITYVGGAATGSETLKVEAFDATTGLWSAASSLTATTTGPLTVNVQNVSVVAHTAIAASSLITSITNPSGDTITQYGFWDSGNGTSNGDFTLNGEIQPDNQWITVNAANLSSVQYVGGAPGSETLRVEVYDATTGTWSAASSLTATTTSQVVVNVQNVTVGENAAIAASTLITSITKPGGDSITEYGFWDGAGTGHFTLNGVAQPDGQWIDVAVGNLSSLQYVGGGSVSAETLYVDAYDATTATWSAYSSLTATTVAAPVTVNVQNVTVAENAAIAASSMIVSVSNPSGDNITQYGFWDGGSGNGHFILNGVVQPDGQWIDVTVANLSSMQYVGGADPGSETLFVEAYDATTGNWSAFSQLTATTKTSVTVNAENVSVGERSLIAGASLITSISNPSGDTISAYWFDDFGTNGGYFTVGGVAQPDGAFFSVTPAQLSSVEYVGGASAGSETLNVTVTDATTGTFAPTEAITATTVTSPVTVNVENFSVAEDASVAAASMIASVSAPSGHTIGEYGFYDAGSGNGHFTLNGVAQPDGQWIDVAATNLSSLRYVGGPGPGTENLFVEAYDAATQIWSPSAELTATTAAAPITVGVQNVVVSEGHSIAASSLITAISNPHGDNITAYWFYDFGTNGGYFTVGGVAQPDGQFFSVTPAQLSSVAYVGGATPGSETLNVTVYDATTGDYAPNGVLTATTTAPVIVSVENVSVGENVAIAAGSLIASVSNASGDSITQYGFWDGGTGNGHFTLSGTIQPDGQWITVSAGAVSSLQYVGGAAAGAENLFVRAYDATTATWSAYSQLTATTTAPVTLNLRNIDVVENTPAAAASLIASLTNPSGDSITSYAFWDGGTGNGHFALSGAAQPDGQWIYVAAGSLGNLQYVGGQAAGSENLFVDAYDATTSTWTAYGQLTATTSAPVVVNVQSISVGEGGSVGAGSLISSVSNPSGDSITMYGFSDAGTGNGHFTLNGAAQPDGQWITVAAGALSSISYVGGAAPGTETLNVEAFDATTGTWSASSALSATTSAPVVVNVQNIAIGEDTTISAQSLINSITNLNGDSITQYGFWDAGSGNGQLTLNGISQPDGQWITVAAAALSTVQYVAGAAPGSESLRVEVFDATTGAWSAVSTLTAITATAPVVANARAVWVGDTDVIASSSLIGSISNANGDNITQYGFWDSGGGNGHFVLSGTDGVLQPFGQWTTVSAGALNTIEYVGGTSPGVQTLRVEIFDATTGTWSAASSLVATSILHQQGAQSDFAGDGKSGILIENTLGAVYVGETGSNNQMTYTQVGGLGSEWSFHGTGDFLGDGKADFLIQNTLGAVYVGEVGSNDQAAYTQVAGLGSEWTFRGTGDFLGDGKADFMIENTLGAVYVGEVGANNQASFVQVAGLGSEWTFRGTGDFLGHGDDQFLIENTLGAVYVGEVGSNNQAAYTQIGGLGSEWTFRGTGDFLGDGKSDFLIENTLGQVFVGEVGSNSQAGYTQIAALGSEWKFVGTGDYLGEGHDQFLIENNIGAVYVGDYTDGQIHYTQVAGLGAEWAFHM